MKIAILSSSNSRNAGGLYTSVRRLTQSLAVANVEPTLFAYNDKFSAIDLAAYGTAQPKAYTLIGPSNFGYSPNLYWTLKLQMPDLIHTQSLWMYLSKVSLRLYKRFNVPHIISPRGMLDPWAVRNSAWKKRIVSRWYENEHLNTASCIHALCQSEADAIRQYGLKNPIAIIPNGIDLPSENLISESAIPNWKKRVPEGKKVLLFLGRIHPKKGLDPLIEAWAMGRKDMRKWCLVIAGWSQGGYQKRLEDKVKQFRLENEILFVGTQIGSAKVASHLHADAFILPSFSEGLPMAVLEAWSYKLPVLITPYCNIPEGFQKNAAISIEPNPEGIINGLKQLISLSLEQRNELGQNGYRLVQKKFTWENVSEQMIEVYKWVIHKEYPPSCLIF